MRRRILVAVLLALFIAASACAQTKDFINLVVRGTPQDVQASLDKGADVNARDPKGLTPLLTAAAYNTNPEVVAVLVEAGADTEARDSIHGSNALMWAARLNQNPDVVTALLNAGANLNAQSTLAGKTALEWAADRGVNPAGMILVLLKAGADAKVVDKLGNTALYYAKYNAMLQGTDALKMLEEASK